MTKVTPISSRKADHIRINLEEDVRSGLTTGLERYRFIHQALPEIDLDQVDLRLSMFEKTLRAPILISSMTGGTKEAGAINQTLAAAAQESGVAMGLGSQRAAVEHPELAWTFQVREVAPDILLFANLGAVQLPVIASGGLRNGLDIAKCIALGARMGGMASPFLKAASQSLEQTIETIQEIRHEIQVCMFAAGARDFEGLQNTPLVQAP
jgi:isopentenyl diphosphate isomerase/L-lactate dehydrogenase-like FMN-dependent dehydrogenase